MHFSVIIPTYNRASTIERALNSVFNQTKSADEIIVVDDGSNDQTPEILEKYKSRVFFIRQENKGVSAARNNGIRQADSEWIALLDSDDEWLPDKLSRAEQYILENPEIKIFQTEEIWIRNGRRVNPKKKHRKYSGMIFTECLPLCIISPSAVVFKKSLWQEAGGFDETLPVCEDYDLWLRISRLYPVGLDKNPGIIKYGGHEDQLSGLYPVMDKYRIQAIEKQLNDPSLDDELRTAALVEIIKKLKIVIAGAKKRKIDHSDFQAKLNKYESELSRQRPVKSL
jgi:glycosyltransferase involved in cell wall biosynthesis